MSSVRRIVLSLAVLAAVTGAACGGDPPDKEIQQAKDAIGAARAGGADQYAKDEFAAAQDALKRAEDAVAQRDYRLALNNALDARERAQASAKEAVDRMAQAQAEAERALIAATSALANARAKLKAAEAAHAPARVLTAARHAIAADDAAVQEARTAIGRHEYLGVSDKVSAATARLRATAHDLEAAAAPAVRRRH